MVVKSGDQNSIMILTNGTKNLSIASSVRASYRCREKHIITCAEQSSANTPSY